MTRAFIQSALLIPILGVIFASRSPSMVFGQVATPTDSPAKNQQIENLKDRLATKVAELTEVRQIAIHGKVTAVSLTTISIETQTKEVKIEMTDGIRVVQTVKGKRTRLSTDDIAKGDIVSVFGDYETQLDLMKAKVVVIENEPPERIIGTITAVDADAYIVTVKTYSGQSYLVDYERSTKAFDWTGTPEFVKSGFSKMKNDAAVTILGVAVPNENNRLSAGRIINLGVITAGAVVQPAVNPVSSGSAAQATTEADE